MGWRDIRTEEALSVSTSRVDSLLAFAKTMEGKNYLPRGCSADLGFDCSGFVQYTFKQFGVNPGRSSRDQAVAGTSVVLAQAQPGDIIVFARNAESAVFHSGIVYETYPDSTIFMHSTASKGVHRTNLQTSSYWRTKVRDVRRISLVTP